MSINYSNIPPHMRDAARLYVENGIEPGSFLTAVICNDLFGALGRADDVNRAAIWDWCNFFYNEVPSSCWGGRDAFDTWVASGGMNAEPAPLDAETIDARDESYRRDMIAAGRGELVG